MNIKITIHEYMGHCMTFFGFRLHCRCIFEWLLDGLYLVDIALFSFFIIYISALCRFVFDYCLCELF